MSIFDHYAVRIVRLDGWEGIYVDDILQEQGPSISRRWPWPFTHPDVPKFFIEDHVAGYYHFLPERFSQIPSRHLVAEPTIAA